MLPPLMFSEDEIEAIVLGSRWVADGRRGAGGAARSALAKIAAVLPDDLRDQPRCLGAAGRAGQRRRGDAELPPSQGHPLRAQAPHRYSDGGGATSEPSGRSRSASSTACAWSSRGASCGRISAISAPIVSPAQAPRPAIRAGARRCSRNGARRKASRYPQ